MNKVSNFELQIGKLLALGKTPTEIAHDWLVVKSKVSDPTQNQTLLEIEANALGYLLLLSGDTAPLKQILEWTLNQGVWLWSLLGEFLGRISPQVSHEKLAPLLSAAHQNRGDHLLSLTSLSEIAVELKLIRTNEFKQWQNQLAQMKADLLHQRYRFENDRLFDEEERVLQKLSRLFPQDADIEEYLQQLTLRKARDIVSRRTSQTLNFHPSENELIPSDLRPWHMEISESLLKIAHENVDQSYDIAISLLMFGSPELAHQALKKGPPSSRSNWLSLEILLETRRFLEALTAAENLEKTHGSEPEAMFSTMYCRARALWGLNRSDQAISLLQNIVDARPSYRSAHALLLAWKDTIS